MKLNEIADNPHSSQARTRVGRGIGSGKGKQAGRGGKGQTARSGVRIKGFEGGQMPLHRRLPKRGFVNPSASDINEVNVGRVQAALDAGKLDAAGAVTIEALVAAGSLDGRVGTVCGKLLTMTAGFDFPEQPLVDSTGIYFTPNLRHLDRGSLEVDNGHFRSYEYVFGATAAAALYRREMIDDISINDEFFDNDFFVYREDADVAWRAQLMGWKCLYAPYAKGYHVRKVLPGNRRALPPEINMHSVKNRFLMRMKNISGDLYRRNFFSITARDLVVVACCLLWEHTSLRAFVFLFRNWKSVMAKRREIMQRRKVRDEYIASWFSFEPVSKPAPKKFTASGARSKAARR